MVYECDRGSPALIGRSDADQSRLLETSAGPLEVAMFGDDGGAPLILVTHGMGSWESLSEIGLHMLNADPRWRIIAWSRPGCGRSPAGLPAAGMDPLTHEAGIVLPALMTALGIGRADFLAHGDGATVALMFAALFPERAGRIAAIAPYAFADAHFAAVTDDLPALETESGLSDRLMARHDDAQAAYSAWSALRRAHVRQDWSALGLMEAVAAPLLLIQGMDDEFSHPDQMSAIAGAVSGPVKWVLLHGQSHFPQHDNPEQIFRLMEGHFSSGAVRAARRSALPAAAA